MFPEVASERLRLNNPQGNIFNSYNWGGYLIWHLFRNIVFLLMGGRISMGIQTWSDMHNSISADWQEIFQEYDIRIVLVEPSSPIAAILLETPGWQKTIMDSTSLLIIQTE